MRITYGDWADVAARRVQGADKALEPIRRKAYNLRRLVAGDSSMIGGEPAKPEIDAQSLAIKNLYDFFIDSTTEGRSNRLVEGVKTLLMQVTHKFPEIEFEDLEPVQAAINAGACKELLGARPKGCSAQDELKLSMLCYLIDGIGWSEQSFDPYTDRPVVRCADTLNMSWDPSSGLPSAMRWASCRKCEPLGYWVEHFGIRKMQAIWQSVIQTRDLDSPLELEFYYDTDGAHGRGMHYVFQRSNGAIDAKPIHTEENPWYFDTQTRRVPYLPYTPMYFLRLPSMRNPISIVEMMLADQIAIWRDEDRLYAVIEHMKQFYAVQKGAMSKKQRDAFVSGQDSVLVEIEENKEPPVLVPAGDLPRGVVDDRQYRERRIQTQGGFDPWAGGSPIEGVAFAKEVEAIKSSSGMTAASCTGDYIGLWVQVVRKFLCALSVYGDDIEVSVRYDGITIEYGPKKSIKERIVPDADISIREDTTIYRSREQAVNEALRNLQIAQSMAAIFPNAQAQAYEKFLAAVGERNVKAYIESPTPTMQPMGGQSPQDLTEGSTAGLQ